MKIHRKKLKKIIENFLFEQEEGLEKESEESEEESGDEESDAVEIDFDDIDSEEASDEESSEEEESDESSEDDSSEEPSEDESSEESDEEPNKDEESKEEDSEEEPEEPESITKARNIAQEINPIVSVQKYIMTLKNNKDTGINKKVPIPANVANALNTFKVKDANGQVTKIIPDTEYDFDTLTAEESVRINGYLQKYT